MDLRGAVICSVYIPRPRAGIASLARVRTTAPPPPCSATAITLPLPWGTAAAMLRRRHYPAFTMGTAAAVLRRRHAALGKRVCH